MPSASRVSEASMTTTEVDGRLGWLHLELGEQARADAHDDGQHQHL